MIKHSVTIQGHRTSISLEAPFWDCLQQMAAEDNISVSALIARIDAARTERLASAGGDAVLDAPTGGLSGTIRIAILEWALLRQP